MIISSFSMASSFPLTFHPKLHSLKRPTPPLSLPCKAMSPKGSPSKEEREEEEKSWVVSMREKVVGEATKVRESLRPKQKGDWKDVVLMSLSFAVYVYISEKIVCAYCAWRAILN